MKTAVLVWGETAHAAASQLRQLARRIEQGETTARGIAGTAGYDARPFVEPIRSPPGWNRDDRSGLWHHFDGDVSACTKVMRLGGVMVQRDVREAGTCPECRRALELPRFYTDLAS